MTINYLTGTNINIYNKCIIQTKFYSRYYFIKFIYKMHPDFGVEQQEIKIW